MWTCVECRQSIEDVLDACWRCGTSREGVKDPTFAPQRSDSNPEQLDGAGRKGIEPLACLRCRTEIEYLGTRRFRDVGGFGDIALLFGKGERLDLYRCPRCGKVERFIDGVGEDLRPE